MNQIECAAEKSAIDGHAAEQERPAVGEHAPRGGRGMQRSAAAPSCSGAAPHRRRHRRAVGAERLHVLGRRAGEQCGRAGRLHGVRHGGPEQRRVGPLRRRSRARPPGRAGYSGGSGASRSMTRHISARVAVDVGADLHERRAPVAAGQRDDVGLGHDRSAPSPSARPDPSCRAPAAPSPRTARSRSGAGSVAHAGSAASGRRRRAARRSDRRSRRDGAPRRRRARPCRSAGGAGAAGDSAAPPDRGGARGGS